MASSAATEIAAPVLMATAGATGSEKVDLQKQRRHRHHHGHKSKHRSRSASAKPASGEHSQATPAKKKRRSKSSAPSATAGAGKLTPSSAVYVPAAPPVFDDAPLVKDDNMAGFVDRHARSIVGIDSKVMKVAVPVNQNKLTYEPFIHFRIRSANDEHIRFKSNALTLQLYGSYKNQNDAAHAENADQTKEVTAARHSLRAYEKKPFMWMDPSVGATGFLSHVDVLVDNVPVNSNSLLGGLWLQYTRTCEILTNQNNVRLKSNRDLNSAKIDEPEFQALRDAVNPLSYGKWNSTTGRRIEAKLRGAFPFEFKNEAATAADNLKEPNYYFPPNTTFDFRFHFLPDKFAAIFHPEVASNMVEYFERRGDDAASGWGVADVSKYDLRFQVMGAFLEYEVAKLRSQQSIDYLSLMRKGTPAIYRYDVIRGQHVALPAGQAYVDVGFTVAPFARLMIIMFVPSWGVIPMPTYRRPLSGFSQFPKNCTKLSVIFANQRPLITAEFERLGFPGEQHHSTQRILYHYLKSHRVWSGNFDELFPPTSDIEVFNQMLYIDLRDSMSEKAESLNIQATFAEAGLTSPKDRHIVVLSVHSTGEVTCRHAGGASHYDWRWESKY